MGDRICMNDQGGERQGETSKPGNKPPDEDADGERRDQEPSKQDGRPTPSGVPNEGRGTEGQGGYKYKGGRQGTGGIPNPDDQDDHQSAGSFRRDQYLNGQLRNPK